MIKEAILKDELLKKIKKSLKDYNCYLVGGYLRDLMSGNASCDRDLIVKSDVAKEIALKISEDTNGHFVPLDEENKIYRVVMPDKTNYFDVSAMLNDDLDADIQRRDLTINALVYDLKNEQIIDKCNAIKDFENKVLRTYSINNFIDDPLRMLRVFRFSAKYGFDIDSEIIDFIKNNTKLINKPAKERINTELMKLFDAKYSELGLKQMDNCGLLCEILPVIEEVKKIPPNSHHHLDLLGHSLETVKQTEIQYEQLESNQKKMLEETSLGNYSRKAFLKLAAFLHDIGKPDTWTIDEETGRHRFIMHDEIGSKKVIPILKELKFSKKQISYIANMIKFHIYPSSLVGSNETTPKAHLKYYRKLSPYFLDNIILAKADRLSALGNAITADMVKSNIEKLSELQKECFEYDESVAAPKPLLTGKDIMNLTGLPQSKELGNIVKALYSAQLEGNITTREEATDFVLKYKQ